MSSLKEEIFEGGSHGYRSTSNPFGEHSLLVELLCAESIKVGLNTTIPESGKKQTLSMLNDKKVSYKNLKDMNVYE